MYLYIVEYTQNPTILESWPWHRPFYPQEVADIKDDLEQKDAPKNVKSSPGPFPLDSNEEVDYIDLFGGEFFSFIFRRCQTRWD